MNGNLRCQEAFHLLNIFHLFTNKSNRLFANKCGIVQQVYPTGQRVIGLNSTNTLKYCSSAHHDTASHSLQFTLLTGVGRVKLRFDDTFLDSRPMRGIQPRTTLTFISHSVSLCISYCVPAICILYVSNSDCRHTISWNGMILSFVVVVYGTAQFIIMKSLLQQPDVLHKLQHQECRWDTMTDRRIPSDVLVGYVVCPPVHSSQWIYLRSPPCCLLV